MSKLIGILLVIATVIFAILAGGNFLMFVDIPSLIFVGGIVVGSLIGVMGVSKIINYNNEENRGKFFDVAKTSSLISGIIGTIIGIIQMLGNLSDPSHIGPAMAVALLTFFYSCLLFLFFSIWEWKGKMKTKLLSQKVIVVFLVGFSINLMTVFLMVLSFKNQA